MKPVIWGLALVLAGCGSANIINLGPDTYSVSVTRLGVSGGATGARAEAYDLGHQECARRGGEFIVVREGVRGTPGLPGSADVDFRCLAADDPDYKRPTLRPMPNTVIEDARAR